MTSTRNIPIKTKIAILTINAGKIREVTFYGLSTYHLAGQTLSDLTIFRHAKTDRVSPTTVVYGHREDAPHFNCSSVPLVARRDITSKLTPSNLL